MWIVFETETKFVKIFPEHPVKDGHHWVPVDETMDFDGTVTVLDDIDDVSSPEIKAVLIQNPDIPVLVSDGI